MPAGLEVIGGSDTILIDGNYSNYHIRDEGYSASATARIYYDGEQDDENLVFVRPRTDGTWVGQWGRYCGQYAAGGPAYPAGNYFQLLANGGGGVDWAVACKYDGTGISVPDTGFGLQVFESGGLVYSSAIDLLDVRQIVLPAYTRDAATVHTYTFPAPAVGKKYYVLLNGMWITRTVFYPITIEAENYGYMFRFTSATTLQIATEAFLNVESFTSSTRALHTGHTPCVLIIER